jgi:ribosome recycling factor
MIDETLFEAEEKMEKAVEVAKEDFAGIRTGRANPGMFNKLLVDYYGSPTPMQQLASFQTPEARTILIKPFDAKAMHGIEKAIRDSDLGVNPSNDGVVIRCILPVLTEDRRRDYIKLAHHKAEEARVSIRNVRRKAKTDLEHAIKDGDIGEDDGGGASREGARPDDQEVRRHCRSPPQGQGGRAARGVTPRPSASR